MAVPDRFAELMARDEAEIDLARACLLIAQDAYPGLDVEGYLGEIERHAARLRGRLPPAQDAGERVPSTSSFSTTSVSRATRITTTTRAAAGMKCSTGAQHPLTLSVLYLEIGRRIGLALEGVSFPGHFLVRLQLRGAMLVLDPFSGGEPQSEPVLRARLRRVIPEGATGPVAPEELPLDQFLEPAGKRQILARLLRNLKGIYREADKPQRLLDVLNRMLTVAPEAHGELRERGLVYGWCIAPLRPVRLSSLEPEAADIEDVRARLMELSALCARLN
jgi:regulator of sirC expression with transglutaminase-like and TPR domain